MLILVRNLREDICINDDIVIKVLDIHKGFVKFGVAAPKKLRVDRAEVRKRINAGIPHIVKLKRRNKK